MTQASGSIAPGAPGLAALSARAAARLAEVGLPTVRLEEWRFTNPAPITKVAWAAPAAVPAVVLPPPLGAWPRHEAALVAGRFAAPAAAVHGARLPAGLRIAGLAAARDATPAEVDAVLGTIAPAGTPSAGFVTQNTARFEDGAYIRVAAGEIVAAPLRVTHLGGAAETDTGVPALVPGRLLVVLAPGASLVLIEDFRGMAARADFSNAVTEIALGEGARLTHVRLVGELATGFHVGAVAVRVGRGARYEASTFATGGALLRDDVHVHFAGEGAEASLDGLFVVSGRQTVDHHTMLDHAVPGCVSRELYKGVLAGSGTGVFNGAVVIRPDAQKSDSGQRNPNLLLSADATIHTKPELQIHADDVKCAHGATVGQLDADALFYLRARGIDAAAARSLLVHAFAREVVDRIAHPGLRADIDAWVESRMERLTGESA